LADASKRPKRANAYKQVLEKVQSNIVTVRAVIKIDVKAEDESESNESKFTLQGVVLTRDGLIMASGVLLSSESFKQLIGAEDNESVTFTITPAELQGHLRGRRPKSTKRSWSPPTRSWGLRS
jgi:hypothetical protein